MAASSHSSLPILFRSISGSSWKVHRDENEEKRKNVKRRLSELVATDDAEPLLLLHIEKLELDRENCQLLAQLLATEKSQEDLSHKKVRAVSKRYRSLGWEIWILRRQIRTNNERLGRIPWLTADSELPFNATLLRLYKDPVTIKKRPSRVQSKMMRNEAIEAYHTAPPSGIVTKDRSRQMLRCLITGTYFMPESIVNARIVPMMLDVEVVEYLFGAGIGARLHSIDNSLPMLDDFELAMIRGDLVFVPIGSQRPVRRWKVAITNDAAREQKLLLVAGYKTLGDLDGVELKFESEHRPAARFLFFHFVTTLFRCRAYQRPGWEQVWRKLGTEEPWATPGPYLRKSMLLVLAQATGVVTDATIEKLVKEATFAAENKLSEDEENELARLIDEAHSEQQERADNVHWDDEYDEIGFNDSSETSSEEEGV